MSGLNRRLRARRNATVEERLRLHMIEAPSGCWMWTGSKDREYGRIQVDGKSRWAHRVSYETFTGPIPDGLQIDHLCRRPGCINPRHLQAVTPSVNTRRGTGPGARALRRERCAAGHDFSEHGVVRAGRRVCRLCRIEYTRRYRALSAEEREARRLAGQPIVGRIERAA